MVVLTLGWVSQLKELKMNKELSRVCMTPENAQSVSPTAYAKATPKYNRLVLVVDGKEYASAAALAAVLGVKPSTLRRPLRRGHSLQSVVNKLRGTNEEQPPSNEKGHVPQEKVQEIVEELIQAIEEVQVLEAPKETEESQEPQVANLEANPEESKKEETSKRKTKQH